MTDIATCLRISADIMAGARFSEAELACEAAAVAAAELPEELAAQVMSAFGDGDHQALEALADALEPPAAPTPQAKPPRQRKPSIRKMIAAAERSGKNVTSITTPDGLTLHFGKVEDTEASNPWLADLDKVTKQ